MPKKSKYTDDTPFSVLVAAYSTKQLEVCASAQIWNNKHLNKTLGEMADALMDGTFDPAWGVWVLYKFGVELDTSIRKRFITVIKDSMVAFRVYLTFSWLTDEEDKLLEEKFKGKLPTAEDELEKGTVTRAKWQ